MNTVLENARRLQDDNRDLSIAQANHDALVQLVLDPNGEGTVRPNLEILVPEDAAEAPRLMRLRKPRSRWLVIGASPPPTAPSSSNANRPNRSSPRKVNELPVNTRPGKLGQSRARDPPISGLSRSCALSTQQGPEPH